jgi:hypothetical protein
MCVVGGHHPATVGVSLLQLLHGSPSFAPALPPALRRWRRWISPGRVPVAAHHTPSALTSRARYAPAAQPRVHPALALDSVLACTHTQRALCVVGSCRHSPPPPLSFLSLGWQSYGSAAFELLRETNGIPMAAYREVMSRPWVYFTTNSKSGQHFFRTEDGRGCGLVLPPPPPPHPRPIRFAP